DLADAGEGAEGRDATAQAAIGVAARQHDFTLAADDRVAPREQHTLPAEGAFADAGRACAALVVHAGKRHGDLELVACREPLLVAELGVELGTMPSGHADGEHGLALGERFLSAKRTRQVQLAARIRAVAALPAQVTNHRV